MTQLTEIRVPELGNMASAVIIEIPLKSGDSVQLEDTLITLESEKASMDIPATVTGTVEVLKVKVGDTVKSGDLILLLRASTKVSSMEFPIAMSVVPPTLEVAVSTELSEKMPIFESEEENDDVHAGPGVRRLAREFGIDLTQVSASGPKGRLLKEDLQQFVKTRLQTNSQGVGLPVAPVVDFSQFGPIEIQSLSRIKKLSAGFLHRNWLLAPHVTQFDEADITELEAFRKSQQAVLVAEAPEGSVIKLTPLVFVMKAVIVALKRFKQFNASLDESGQSLVLKRYYHIGVAVDTLEGLVVPVIRDVDQKGLVDLAIELASTSQRAKEGKLRTEEMQGSSFTISSLGGIGGGSFTPIINIPDVAILGIAKATLKPIYQAEQWVPRLYLPMALSYDHRVIDGAEGAYFMRYLVRSLNDIRQWLL